MKRGEIWTIAGGGDYTGKPRPAVIIQGEQFEEGGSVTICAFTSDPTEAPVFRIKVEPSEANGLRQPSSLMVDKVNTVRRVRLGKKIGRLADQDVLRLNRGLLVFLGLAGSSKS